MTKDHSSFDEAEEGEYVGNVIKSGDDSFKVPMKRTRIHSEPDNRMTQFLHRTAKEYGLEHSDAAAIYNEVSGHLADTRRLDEEQFETDIENALEDYSNNATAAEVVEEYELDKPREEPYATIDEIVDEFS